MADGKRFRIGEFARLSGTSIKTLRYYDQLGLLRPSQVDTRTRYRWYDAAQLQELAAIRALQELGASLADIRRVLTCSRDPGERRKLLIRLRSDALRRMNAARHSLDWLDVELEDANHVAGTPVHLKERGEVRIASIRASLSSYADIAPVERELVQAVHPRRVGEMRGVLWHRCEASGAIDGEPFVEVSPRTLPAHGYGVSSLPSVQVASAYCESDDAAAVRTYDAIDRWIHRHSFRLEGPKREIYVGSLLEIQFPVRRA